MYRTKYQRGLISVFFSVGAKPLASWDTYVQDGYITRFLDHEIKSMVLEIVGSNLSTTYMVCPKGKSVLGIRMPFLVMLVKNLNKYFSFEVTILDDTGTRRRLRISNFQSTTQVHHLCTVMPINLADGWNQIQFNLAEFTRRAYKKQFIEVQKVKINANIRVRRVYFTEKILPEDQMPAEYRLYFPVDKRKAASNIAKPIPKVEEETARTQDAATITEIDLLRKSESMQTSNFKIIGKSAAVSSQTLRAPSKSVSSVHDDIISRQLTISQEVIKEVPNDTAILERTDASTTVITKATSVTVQGSVEKSSLNLSKGALTSLTKIDTSENKTESKTTVVPEIVDVESESRTAVAHEIVDVKSESNIAVQHEVFDVESESKTTVAHEVVHLESGPDTERDINQTDPEIQDAEDKGEEVGLEVEGEENLVE